MFPALKAKRENFPLRADHNLHYLDAIVPERLSEYVNVEETSSVMLWHGRLGQIDAQIFQKLTQEKCTGMGVKDADFSVSSRDTCSLAKSKQQNHAKVALIEVMQPLDLVYTDLSGPISPACGAGHSYVATFTDRHTRLLVGVLSEREKQGFRRLNHLQPRGDSFLASTSTSSLGPWGRNCDTCSLAKSKQQNHPKVALTEVTQPLDLGYTDLSGPISPACGAGHSYVAIFIDHHTRLLVGVLSEQEQ